MNTQYTGAVVILSIQQQYKVHKMGLYLVQWLSSEIKLGNTYCTRYWYIHPQT